MTRRDLAVGVDERVPPFVWVPRADIDVLHACFDGRRLAIARSIYFALVARITAADHEFTRGELADDAGVTKKTLDEYVPVFEERGLLRVERRRDGAVNLPNVWHLLTPAPEGVATEGAHPRHAEDPSHGDDPQQSSADLSNLKVDEGRSGSPAWLPTLEEVEIPDDLIADGDALLRRKTKVDGRQVTPEEMGRAVVAIAEFNRQSESGFGVGAHLRAIVMRIRERPSYDAAAHVRLVQSAFRLKWWERMGRGGRRATPAVIYGNPNVFEQVVQDAVDEKRGKAPAEAPASKSRRFTRDD